MPSAAAATSASSKTITGALPPSSRWTRFTSAAADAATSMPARTLPVIETMAGVGCSTSSAAGVAVPADHVEDARRAGARHMISAISSVRGRGGVRRLEHHGVAGGDGRRPLPHGHHQRVVPRRDRRADPDGLPPDERGVVRPCTRRPTCPRAGGRRRRRTGSGRPVGGISSAMVSATGLPVFAALGRAPDRRPGPRGRRRCGTGRGCARRGWLRATRGRRRPPRRHGRGRRPSPPRPARRGSASPVLGSINLRGPAPSGAVDVLARR